MKRSFSKEIIDKIGKTVLLSGWINSVRSHGKLVFFDLRDRWGLVQAVVQNSTLNLNPEDVVFLVGKVRKRPKGTENPNLSTGRIEIEAEKIEIINKARTLPFPLETGGLEIDEELRLKYRYLDLRRPRLVRNLELRHKVVKFIHQYMDERGFIEVETPLLTKATPEGARDFLVPSRLHQGKFYALPQSPQQYKQLLMVAGFERYYQIARCLRDEDLRSDRQFEFTQLDLEMSFVTQDEILSLVENLMIQIVEKLTAKKILKKPFPKLTFEEAKKKYQTDKPDLREDKNDKNTLAFAWIVDFPMYEWKENEKRWESMHHPFTMPKKEHLKYLETKELGKIKANSYDLVCNGYELASGSIRITDPLIQSRVFEVMGLSQKEIQEKFGHLLTAFSFGTPPMGGMAPSVDRLVMLLSDEENIREVIAFPASSKGISSVMNAPSKVEDRKLKELGIKIFKKRQTS